MGIQYITQNAYLASRCLADKSTGLLLGEAMEIQAESLDMGVRCCAVVAVISLNLADLDHRDRRRLRALCRRMCYCS